MAETSTPTYVVDRRIGKAVAAEVAYAGVSRQSVAEHIGIDKSSFSRSVAGKRQWKAAEIIDIAQFLDIPVSYLLEPRRPAMDGEGAVTGQYRPPTPIRRLAFELVRAA